MSNYLIIYLLVRFCGGDLNHCSSSDFVNVFLPPLSFGRLYPVLLFPSSDSPLWLRYPRKFQKTTFLLDFLLNMFHVTLSSKRNEKLYILFDLVYADEFPFKSIMSSFNICYVFFYPY